LKFSTGIVRNLGPIRKLAVKGFSIASSQFQFSLALKNGTVWEINFHESQELSKKTVSVN